VVDRRGVIQSLPVMVARLGLSKERQVEK